MIGAIVQARMSSTRLPGKTLADIAGEPMLAHVLRRVKGIAGIDQVIIATTENPVDVAISRYANDVGVPCYVGSEFDVLDRFYQTARHFGVSVIVRVTPDCPLLDPQVSALVLRRFIQADSAIDYVSNVHPPTFPDGLDTEVFTFSALERAWREAVLPSEREHVTPYVWKRTDVFRLLNVNYDEDLSNLRWTVDELEDLEFVRRVYDNLGDLSFGLADVLALLKKHPELAEVNVGIERNAGYQKSLCEDIALIGQVPL